MDVVVVVVGGGGGAAAAGVAVVVVAAVVRCVRTDAQACFMITSSSPPRPSVNQTMPEP